MPLCRRPARRLAGPDIKRQRSIAGRIRLKRDLPVSMRQRIIAQAPVLRAFTPAEDAGRWIGIQERGKRSLRNQAIMPSLLLRAPLRSEERRVGKEGVRTFKS